jgi:CRISPR-associated protein (TIGR03984 family)
MLRIFNDAVELRAWRVAEGRLRAVLVTDHASGMSGARDATYLLLGAERGGDRPTVNASGVKFTLLQNERGEAALVPADAGESGRAAVLRARLHHACDEHGQWVLRSTRWLRLDVCTQNELSESAADTSEV